MHGYSLCRGMCLCDRERERTDGAHPEVILAHVCTRLVKIVEPAIKLGLECDDLGRVLAVEVLQQESLRASGDEDTCIKISCKSIDLHIDMNLH